MIYTILKIIQLAAAGLLGFISALLTVDFTTHFIIKHDINIKDPTLVYYVKWFQNEAKEYGLLLDYSNLTIEFGDTTTNRSSGAMGYCQRLSGFKKIVLNKEYFARADEYTRKSLVAHEMGHCVLNRRHYLGCIEPRGYLDSGCEIAVSIMYPFINAVPFESNPEYYLNELFANYEDMEIPYFE